MLPQHSLRSASGVLTFGLVALASAQLSCGKAFTGIDESAGGAESGSGAAAGDASVQAGGGGKAPIGGGGGGGGTELGGVSGSGAGGSSGAGVGLGGSPEHAEPPQDGLELWLAGDRGVIEVSGVVATWKDGSSKGRDAAQTATNYRPRLQKSGAGLAGIIFDGVDDFLKLPPLDADFSAGVSIFAVALQESTPECMPVFEASNGAEVEDLHLGELKGTPLYEVGAVFVHSDDVETLAGQGELLAAIHQKNGMVQLRRNSAGIAESTVELPPLVTRSEVYLGRTLYANCSPWRGGLAELLVYSRAVTDQELVAIETYLQRKWGCCTQ